MKDVMVGRVTPDSKGMTTEEREDHDMDIVLIDYSCNNLLIT